MTSEETNRRAEILDAALEVFAEVGYRKATIKAIASRAGLKSPALIYWYFPNKEALLKATIGAIAPAVAQVENAGMIFEMPLEVALPLIGKLFLSALDMPKTPQLIRVFFGEAIHNPEVVRPLAESGPLLVLNLLVEYFRRQVERNHISGHNPAALARAYIGGLLVYMMGKVLFPPLGEGAPPPDEYLNEVVGVFLRGLKG